MNLDLYPIKLSAIDELFKWHPITTYYFVSRVIPVETKRIFSETQYDIIETLCKFILWRHFIDFSKTFIGSDNLWMSDWSKRLLLMSCFQIK